MSETMTSESSTTGSRTAEEEDLAPGVEVNPKAWNSPAKEILTPEAAELIGRIHRELEPERQKLLEARRVYQARIDGGELPDFPDRNSEAIQGDWKVAPIPEDLMCRRVEITGPVNSAKMVINMLSRNASGARADTAMLDFEDAVKPSWNNLMSGYTYMREAAKGTLAHQEKGKEYRLDAEDMAVIIARPRGLHLDEANLRVDGTPVSGSLMDAVLTFYHAGRVLHERGKTPNYYIPKVEHHPESAWWDRLFTLLEDFAEYPVGTIKATFLIETLPAAYQMEEILYSCRAHAVGLNVGRWDKIFSDIKTLRNHPDRVMADRASITMQQPWMENYAKRCVHVCHSRGAFAVGGMAAFTPGKEPEVRKAQTDKVLADKTWEADAGHDGCWVSHPFFIGPAMEAFTKKNQLSVVYSEAERYPDLLPMGQGPRTLAGLRTNVRVGIGYLNGWNQDIGCVAWDDLMEDLATLEISRAQTWQWLRYGIQLDDGPEVTGEFVRSIFAEELKRIAEEVGQNMAGQPEDRINSVVDGFKTAARDAEAVFLRKELQEFLTFTSEPVV